MEKPILIVSASLDEHAYGPVSSILENRGYPAVVYRTDKVLSGEDRLEVEIKNDGELEINYNQQLITPERIGAAWYRKLNAFSLPNATHDRAKQLYLTNEIKYLHDAIWALYPEEVWLNAPDRMHKADRKLGQLMLANELGFSTPDTVVGNDWAAISSGLLSNNRQMIVKMIRGVISEDDKIKALYTTVLDESKVNELQNDVTPFPGIYQPFIDKYREWRVTVVGEDVFPTAIYTDELAKDDWRKLQTTNSVQFKNEKLPSEISLKCIDFLKISGLKFGAFDFIETAEGEIVFLECNPNGQYGWLEEGLGFPISNAIADELIKIAQEN